MAMSPDNRLSESKVKPTRSCWLWPCAASKTTSRNEWIVGQSSVDNERTNERWRHQLPISATTTMYDRSQFGPNEPATIMCLAGHICLAEPGTELSWAEPRRADVAGSRHVTSDHGCRVNSSCRQQPWALLTMPSRRCSSTSNLWIASTWMIIRIANKNEWTIWVEKAVSK